MLAGKIGYFRATAWTPRSIANLGMWWDASVASSITLNGSTVSQWNDLSGNNRHLYQPTAILQPTYTLNGRNGRNVITMRSDQSPMWTNPTQSSASQIYNVTSQSVFWAVVSPAVNNVQARVFSQIVTGQNNDFSGTNYYIPPYFSSSVQVGIFAAGSVRNQVNYTSGDALVMSFVHNGTTASVRLNRGTPATSNWTMNTSVGVAGILGSNITRGTICEIIVYNNAALSEADRTVVERYLAAKWGITVA